MAETELRELREGFGFAGEEVALKKNLFGSYNTGEVDRIIDYLKKNCHSMQKAFEEKNAAFAEGISAVRQEAQQEKRMLEQLKETLQQKEELLIRYKAEIANLLVVRANQDAALDELKHIRSDETLQQENTCLQQQLEENRREIDGLRKELLCRENSIFEKEQEIQRIKLNVQAELNLTYRNLEFRMEKLRSLMGSIQDMSIETDNFITAKLEEIARGTHG